MINVSIVLYNHSVVELLPLLESLRLSGQVNDVFLIDNSPLENTEFRNLHVRYIFTGNNRGYGAGHNIALRQSLEQNVPYHLVVNPDISFDPGILARIVEYMDKNTEIGHLMPKVFYPDGNIQYLCKLLPTPFDLLFRRFLPGNWTKKRMFTFEMRGSGYDKIMDVPYLSGCFMFLRIRVLNDVGLFDERFFMYPEDIDLTRRIHKKYRTVFYPDVSIVHHHEQSSYKNRKMMWVHIVNLIWYFNKWGWLFDPERRAVNKEILGQFD